MRTLALLVALTRSSLILLRRYLFDTSFQLLAIYIIFLLIFLGYRADAGAQPGFGDTVAGLVVSFAVFTLAIGAFSQIATYLMGEALQGTLEQLAMSPLGLGRVMLCRLAGQMLVNVIFVFFMLFLMMLTSGQWLRIDFASVLPLLIVVALGVQGIGYVLGGLAIVFKRIQSSFLLVQFALVALIAIPPERLPAIRFLPLSTGTKLIREVMVEERSLLELPAPELGFLLANSAVYFGLGFLVFKAMERVARQRGLLGHY